MKPYERAISTRLKHLAGVIKSTKTNKLRSSDTTKLNTFKIKQHERGQNVSPHNITT